MLRLFLELLLRHGLHCPGQAGCTGTLVLPHASSLMVFVTFLHHFSSSLLPSLKAYEITRLLLQSKTLFYSMYIQLASCPLHDMQGQEKDEPCRNYDQKFTFSALAGKGLFSFSFGV